MNKTLAILLASVLAAGLAAGCADDGFDETSADPIGSTDRPLARNRYYYKTWKTVQAWCNPFPHDDDARCGTLYAGRNYFYCQVKHPAQPYSDNGYYNDWYAYTDLDSPAGSHGWVSAVHFTVGGNWEPIPGLPVCAQ